MNHKAGLDFARPCAAFCHPAHQRRAERRLRDKCKEAYAPTELALVEAQWPVDQSMPSELFRQVGCSACSETGYKGRLALHEVMAVTEGIERLAFTRASGEDMRWLAREQGMQTLRHDGLARQPWA